MIQYIVSCMYSCYTDCAKVVTVKDTSVILIDWHMVEAQFWYIGAGWDVQLTIWETYSHIQHIIILSELEVHINSDKWKMEAQFWYIGPGWDVQLRIWRIDEKYILTCKLHDATYRYFVWALINRSAASEFSND